MTITNFRSAVLVAHEKEPAPAGFAATSASPLTIALGSVTLLTQSGLAYRPGSRVRLISAADPVDYMEGQVTAYSGSSMTVNITRVGPTADGLHADWSIVVAGEPGSGDLLSSLNLADVDDADAARMNLGAGDMVAANNLSELPDVEEAKRNLRISISQVFTPEQFGGGPGVSDNVAAFTAMAAAVRAAGGGVIDLKANAVYTVYASALTPGFYTMLDFTGVHGLTINCNGAKITTPVNFEPLTGQYVTITAMHLEDASEITINDFWLDQSTFQTASIYAGFIGIDHRNTVRNVVNNGFRMTGGGRAGIWCTRVSGQTFADRAHGMVASCPSFENVAYPLSFQKSFDQVIVRGAFSKGADRCYFAYNVRGHDIEISSDANRALQDVIISNSFDSSESYLHNTTADIKLRYTCDVAVGPWTPPNAFICITFQTGGGSSEGKAAIRNLDINAKINNQATNHSRPVLIVLNQTTSAKSRQLENVKISGSYFLNASAAGNFMELFVDKDWTGDAVSNFSVDNFAINSAGATQTLRVDGRAINGPFNLKNIRGTEGAAVSFSASNMSGAAPYLNYSQVWLPSIVTP